MPDLGATALFAVLLVACTAGLFWIASREVRTDPPSKVNEKAQTGSPLAVAWVIMAVVMALCTVVAACFELVAGEPLIGITLLISSPLLALGPLTVAYAIRWSIRVEAMLMPPKRIADRADIGT